MRTLIFGIALSAGVAAGADLFRDDFSRYPPGQLTTPVGELNGAIQEYHYLPHRGVPLGPWANVICHLDAWAVSDEDGKPYLEQHLTPDARQFSLPIFLTGDPEWHSYTVEASVKPLSLEGMAGVVFRYHTNRHYYLFALTGGGQARLALHLPLESALRVRQWKELGSAAFPYDTLRYYRLRVESDGARIRAYVDGKLLIEAEDSEIVSGTAGLIASAPARFQKFAATASDAVKQEIERRISLREAELEKLRASNPRPRLWKKFDTPGFGAGRNVRFGDLDGDGVPDMLFAQNIPRVRGDAFDAISCLTAVTLDGKVLWQLGRPDPRNGLLTNDTPFQIHDIDGDGRNEVVLVRDFKLQILDGATGKLKRWVWMPKAPAAKDRPYERVSGDSIAFLNLSGDKGRRELLVKDRYEHFWVFNNRLEPLWQGQEQTGHYPFPFDVNNDGRDEVAVGYSLWSPEGKRLWTQGSVLKDHADGVMIGNLSGDPNAKPRMYASGSDEGFIILDMDGKILKHVRVGHNQSPTAGKYRPDLPGLQYMSVNFWRNPGIITLFDWDGNILAQEEPIHTGSPVLPVNWRGDGQEFVLLSGNVREGGMIDGHLRRAVLFPDDGHPDLAANVLNLTGDPRDEIVLWDPGRVWIYTQDRPFEGARIYAPLRNPDYNESNYRTTVSLPNWEDKKAEWQSLFDGKSLQGWRETPFSGHGPVRVEKGAIILGAGAPMTGITRIGSFPQSNYEVRFEAARLEGNDFFASLTFPVGDSFCTWITGGWGGDIVGLSSIAGWDASDNETRTYFNFENGRWYSLRLRVTGGRISGWIDEKPITDVVIAGRAIGLRPGEIKLSAPLGFASYATTGGLRKIEYRALPPR